MTTTKSKKVTTKKAPALSIVSTESAEISNNLIGVTDTVLKSLSILAASLIHSAPQFAFQTNQTSVVQLADVFFSYMSGAIQVEAGKDVESPKFG